MMAETTAPATQLDTTLTRDPWRRAAEIRPQGIGFTALVYQWVRVGGSVYQAPIVGWRGEGGVTIAANGAKQVWDRCDPCAKNARGGGILIPHAVAGRLEYYRVIEDYSESAPPCEVCGSRGTELHHWAPRYLFADAEAWPQSHLCLVCHRRWHEIVTPGMCEK